MLLLALETTAASGSPPDLTAIIWVLTGLVGFVTSLLVGAYYIKQLFFAHIPEGSELISEKRFKEAIMEIRNEIREAKLAETERLLALEKELQTEKTYTHENVHKMRTDLQVQTNRTALLDQRITEVMANSLKKLEDRFDRHDRALAAMGYKLSQLIGQLSRSSYKDTTSGFQEEEDPPQAP